MRLLCKSDFLVAAALMIASVMMVAPAFSANASAQQHKIATVSPMGYSLSKLMAEGTQIEVSYLPPTRLPINRVASWLRKHRSQPFTAFDAFVGMRSVQPALDIYPSLRQSNIRIVDIDIAQAIMPNGEKVVQANDTEYFWLNSNNLLVMLGILKRDLTALWPQYASQFNQNYQSAASSIRQINLQIDDLLMAKDIAFIVVDNEKFKPFAASLASDTANKQDAEALGLNYLELASGKHAPESSWKIDDFSRFNDVALVERLRKQYTGLVELLESK